MNTFAGFHLGHSESLVWLADALAKGTIALLIVAIINLLFRKRSAAAQYWLWLVGLAGLVVVPLLSGVLPGWHALPSHAVTSAQVVAANAQADASIRSAAREQHTFAEPRAVNRANTTKPPSTPDVAAVSSIPPPTPTAEVHTVRRAPIQWIRLVLTAWAIGFALSLLPLVLGMLSLWRLERRCKPLRSDDWQKLLKSAATKLGLRKEVALLQSAHRAMPMTWGIFRTKLLVPMEASEWPAAYQRDVLLHELAHVKRADCLTDLLARLICAIYWFHPLAWFALLRMRDLRERACDDMVLAAGADASQYAEHLLQVAAIALPNRFAVGGISMARRSNFRGRVEAILDEKKNRSALGRLSATMIAGAALCAAMPLAMLRAGESPQVKSPPPATTQSAADITGDVLDSDGKPVVGAEVQMISRKYEKGTIKPAGYDVVSQTRSDEGGNFHLAMPPVGQGTPYLIRATAPGYAYGYVVLQRSPGSISYFDNLRLYSMDRPSIVLAPESRLSGVVVDSRGNPIAGAEIRCGVTSDPVITDATGRFAFAKAQPFRFGVFYGSNMLAARHPNYVLRVMYVEDLVAGTEKSLRITLEEGLLLRGRLSDADTGQLLKGFNVSVESADTGRSFLHAESDDTGYYEVRVPNARVVLHPSAPSSNDDSANYYPAMDTRTILPKPGVPPLDVDFQFRRARKITGRIMLNGQMDPSTWSVESGRHTSPVDSDGVFHLTQLKAGIYDVEVKSPPNHQYMYATTRTVTVDAEHDVTDLSFDLRGLSSDALVRASPGFKVVVRYPDGKPAANAQVIFSPDSEPATGPSYRPQYTLRDGTFEAEGFDPLVHWTIWVLDSTRQMGASQLLTTPEFSKTPVQLTLQPGAEFSGQVVDQNGKPMPGFMVGFCEVHPMKSGWANRPLVREITDEQGRYRVSGFVPPAGVKGFILEAIPMHLDAFPRVPTTNSPYRNFDIVPGTKVGGYDFEVTLTESHLTIEPKAAAATQPSRHVSQPVAGSENRGDSVPPFSR